MLLHRATARAGQAQGAATAAPDGRWYVTGVRLGITHASPDRTSSPRWLMQTVRMRMRLRARTTSVTSARAVMVSPALTGFKKVSDCDR